MWHTYILKFSDTSVAFLFGLYCWRCPMIAVLCLNGTPDNITLNKYGIISLFTHWWLYYFVNLVRKYSPALFQYYPFENRDAFMNLCPNLCVRNVVKWNSEFWVLKFWVITDAFSTNVDGKASSEEITICLCLSVSLYACCLFVYLFFRFVYLRSVFSLNQAISMTKGPFY